MGRKTLEEPQDDNPPAAPQVPPPAVPEVAAPHASGRFVFEETLGRIVDLCRHAQRTDAGGTGRLATQILADLQLE
jgi:hypothetical protein